MIKKGEGGFTLLEIIVAMVLFAGVMAGLVGVFVAGKRHVIHSRERMTGGEIEKLFIDPLGMAVRQDTWGQPGNELTTPTVTKQKVNNTEYTPQYTVSSVTGTDLRKVKVKVNWTETSP